MTIYAYGHDITTCGFCEGIVRYRIEGQTVTVCGRVGWSSGNPMMPLFCSDECERASEVHLDERVNV